MKKLLIAIFSLGAVCSYGQKLDKFGAEMGKKSVMGKEIRVPYTDVVSYYGYIKPGSKPDEVRGGKNYYYLYVWIPAAAPELGIRMASPVPAKMAPEGSDYVSAAYTENKADAASYFDTWISFERAEGIVSKGDLAKASKASWKSYETNDDSSEMPAQPSGNKYNSLMRITSDVNNPAKALVAGLYRVGFTTYKTGDVKGSFVAQLGAPVKLPGVVVAQSLDELAKQVK
ncbi:Lipl32 family lipoprotein [Flavobacterium sp. J372]|uniref:Lipl32 family lipoprotein n=1 Tax=Flavobacterium sp. J372 TaxID=2898436 RepID=UPI0021519B56|nr:Lipl32 family lipoprotein [Flavobacterium sp. J372]MCR5862753.1 Lipl32 family lipoprotein [Flavobacterium sp. J372]